MKFSNVISLLATGSLAVAANVDKLTAEAECGLLGVMEAPASAYATGEVRKCRDHPDGHNKDTNPPSKRDGDLSAQGLEKRCAPTDSYGCGGTGFCWKSCGTRGEWCWTASNYGHGPWQACTTKDACGTDPQNYGCGGECGC